MLNLAEQKDLIKTLAEKYGKVAPRYTSYPTAPEWKHEFSQQQFETAIVKSNQSKKDFSLYLHLPFCESQCYFCGCNVVISPQHGIENEYLQHLKQEIDYYSKLFDKNRKIIQMAWGGGTPTYLSPEQIRDLAKFIDERFSLYSHDDSNDHEYAVEIDPRFSSAEHLQALWDSGFNRLSMGIQDFNPETQTAINRLQSYELVENIVSIAREIGFTSINFDLIYGLPHQDLTSFEKTINQVVSLNPDRIALFNYAHIPSMFAHQRKYIDEKTLPDEEMKVKIFDTAVEKFTNAGYVFIGLDHFAKANDSLSIAQQNHSLYRNFQGYTTHAGCDLLGLGMTAISDIRGVYKQNVKKINDYYEDFRSADKFMICSQDDIERREIIKQIMCNGKVRIELGKYTDEIQSLRDFEADEILDLSQSDKFIEVELTELGRFFSRNISAVFDNYLKSEAGHKLFSKVL